MTSERTSDTDGTEFGKFSTLEEAKDHYEQELTRDPDDTLTHYYYGMLLYYYYDAPEKAREHYEQALALWPEFSAAHYEYAILLYEEFTAPREARPHLETALDSALASANKLSTIRYLVRVCRTLDDEAAAIEHCEHALDISSDHPADARWFESVYAVLTGTDRQTRYTHGLIAVLDEHHTLALELLESVWMEREESISSDTHDVILSAGVVLAALVRYDGDDSHTHDAILTGIEPSFLSPPVSSLFERLDTGAAEPLDISPTDDPPGDLPLQTLERRTVAHLLDRLES